MKGQSQDKAKREFLRNEALSGTDNTALVVTLAELMADIEKSSANIASAVSQLKALIANLPE